MPTQALEIPIDDVAHAYASGVAAERERCAQIVETMTEPSAYAVVVDAGKVIAGVIRNKE